MKNTEAVKKIIAEIEREDSLPSNAGNLFRDILRYEGIGWRELNIVNSWIVKYLDTTQENREMILKNIDL